MNTLIHVQIVTPLDTAWTGTCGKVSVQTTGGWWTFLPRHREMVALVVPGIVTAWLADGGEILVAVDEGLLTKRGPDLTIATRHAAVGRNAEDLKKEAGRQFAEARAGEELMQQVIGRLETDFIRCFVRADG
jgi:F-type H+-transporting ATPase subunit epsilon